MLMTKDINTSGTLCWEKTWIPVGKTEKKVYGYTIEVIEKKPETHMSTHVFFPMSKDVQFVEKRC